MVKAQLSWSWNSESLSDKINMAHTLSPYGHLILQLSLLCCCIDPLPTAMMGFIDQPFLNISEAGQGQWRVTWEWALAESAFFRPTSMSPDWTALLCIRLEQCSRLCIEKYYTDLCTLCVDDTWVIVQQYTWHLAPPPFPNQLVTQLHFISILSLFRCDNIS